MKKLSLLLFFIVSVFLFVSCSKSVVFDEKVVFPDHNWAFEQKAITFDVPLQGSDKPFSVILELELVGTQNVDLIYSTFSIFTPKGAETVKALYFNFVSPQEPYIQGSSSNEKIYRMTVYPKKYFSESGTYRFEIDQYSTNADNYGIRSLRMLVEKVKEN
ncbi:MAG: hypothetical protein LBU83_06820 [Bacteroidales bacterium]|jgi:hypothetical protein|nr:hypothetical protein [Bacteroidales bacterium]